MRTPAFVNIDRERERERERERDSRSSISDPHTFLAAESREQYQSIGLIRGN